LRLIRGNKILQGLIFAFLAFNLVIRFGTIFRYPPYNGVIAGLFGGVILACLVVIFSPRYLRYLLFIFGSSLFLFGFGSIDIQSRIFELLVTCLAAALFIMNWRAKKGRSESSEIGGQQKGTGGRLNRPLLLLILCYVGLSLFSILLLPVRQILRDFWFFGFPDCFFYLFIGPPYGFYFPVAAVIELALFVVLAVELSSFSSSVEIYSSLFTGIFSGGVFSAFIGLLDFYGVISLAWYRFGETISPGVLHSTFQNRNCFGEFVLTVIPFVMIGFLSKIKGVWWKILLFGCLVICEVALILAGGRAGWVTYPLILFICWLFSYFSKEGRLQVFRFKWRDLLKVTISVPITLMISLLLVFCVLMPLGEQLEDKSGISGISRGSGQTSQYLASRLKTIAELDTGSRDRTWGQGISAGRESPMFGLGYETFFFQAHILDSLSDSYFSKFRSERERIFESPHNVFLSIFVSGGIVGVWLWLLIIGYALMNMIFDIMKNGKLMNIPVLISIISFHMYGMVQSMQYIPMIWLLIFLCLGYAMTIDDAVLPNRLRRLAGVLTTASVALVIIGLFVYLGNFESKDLAEKYGLRIYALGQDQDRFAGFYQPSQRWTYGDYRWSGERGAIYVPENRGQETEGGRPRLVVLEFHCMTPGTEDDPVVVTVSHEGRVLDKIVFKGMGGETQSAQQKAKGKKLRGESIVRRYDIPDVPGKEERLLMKVSRTWIPHNHLGNFDRRELGVGVKIL